MLGYMAKRIKITDGIKAATYLTLRWEDYIGLIRWAKHNHKSPCKWKRETEGRGQERKQGEKEPPNVGFEDAEMGP